MSPRIRSLPRDRHFAASLSLLAAAIGALLLSGHVTTRAQGPGCTPPNGNPIVCENQLTGNPPSEWDISGAGDATIQGFATDISVNKGGTINFKVATTATAYRIDIYRLGYYAGMGARKVATVLPSATLPQTQPACLTNPPTGLVDCGNWALSASWAVPATATSGIYIGKLVNPANGDASHMVFVVRDDTGQSDILLQASDTTWQAYNDYGGNSLYVGQPAGRAYKVSYNRPFVTRGNTFTRTWLFGDEYPMVRWLEANGYSVSYSTGVDTDRRPAELLEHKIFMSSGHDEYWSGTQRANVEAARAAGVHLAFFSGNEVFWKTRWENSIDASGTAYRTLVSYKDTLANDKIDPLPNVWTGTWRDARFSPPADGGRPENALTGTIFMGNCCGALPLTISAAEGQLRFWRNTPLASLAPGTTSTIAPGIIGYEFDAELDNGFRPAGLMRLSTSSFNYASTLLDNGSQYGPGPITHALTLYRHASGALVFSSGTNRWSWALDTNHDLDGMTPNILETTNQTIQQATVNLFADMSAQPLTLQSGLISSPTSTDTLAPASTISSPVSGTVPPFSLVVVSGTATDSGGGHISSVEVSVDNGGTWHRATGFSNWTYNWGTGAAHSATIRSRAVDDSGNVEQPTSGVNMTVGGAVTCPCSIWPPYQEPTVTANQESASLELGVKFQTDTVGYITGIRYYKSGQNTGVHTGSLWTNAGALLATATFTSESLSGWQQVAFSSPVAVTANTTYVASYHTDVGFYSADLNYFATQGFDNGPLHALSQPVSLGNGLYRYGATAFPNQTYAATNYWVDVVFANSTGSDTTPPTVVSTVPAANGIEAGRSLPVSASFSEVMAASTVTNTTFTLRDAANTLVPATVTYTGGSAPAALQPSAALAPGAIYTATLKGGPSGLKDLAGNPLNADYSWSFTTATFEYSIWPPTAVPTQLTINDATATELGLKFRATADGFITGIRFYKSSANTGVHTGSLWTLTGTLLGTVAFTNETASGWQQATLGAPVAVTANTTYVVSYHSPNGVYSANPAAFASVGVTNAPLEALSNAAAGGNGVYLYGTATFPTQTYNSTNYWVDVVFTTSIGPDTTGPTVTARTPAPGATNVAATTAVTATFNEDLDGTTVSTASVELRNSSNALVAATVGYASGTRTATLQPTSVLGASATYTARVRGGATGVKDLAGNALAADVTWTFTTTAASDTTPPTVAGTTPANGSTSGSRSQPLIATFSEPIAAATVTSATFELRDATSALVPATVTYVAGSGAATLQPTGILAPVSSYTATLRGGPTGVKDLSGNPLSADYVWTFTTVGQEYSIWPPTAGPTTPTINDATDLEVGLKFRASVDGSVTGIRFYKGSGNTGVHTGSLWTIAGALLGTVTFTNETASGWQEATLSAPVAVTANTTYLVSYHTPTGVYSATSAAFASVGVINGPLEALSNAAAAGNGVYRYGLTAFPTDTFNSNNYWVDVVFASSQTLPTVSVADVSVTEGNTGTVGAAFTLTLSPASTQAVSVNYATANGTAVAPGDYTGATGTVTFAAGSTTQTITVPVVGDVLSEANETFVVNLSGAVNATIADGQGVGTIIDNDTGPSIAINDVTVTEGNTGTINATFTVTLSVASGQPVSVNYATANGTAVAPGDYTTTTGTLTFAAGSTTQSLAVPVVGDLLDELNESFVVNLSGATNATIADAQGAGTITDNDATPSLVINNVTVAEGNTGTTNAVFTVTLSAASGQTVAVNYATANGTALAPADYTTVSGTVTFAPGTTTQSIAVPIVGDILDEANDTYFVNLSGATNATIADTQGAGTITDDDATPSFVINNVTVAEGNTGTVAAVFTVTLSAVSGRTTTVNYTTANGTAIAPGDYTTTSGTLTFAAGSTTQTITVLVAGDALDEADETYVVNLSAATNATIADTQGAGTITDDDPTPSLVIDNVTVTEGNSGTQAATFTVTLSALSGRAVTVNFATANGTATTAGGDYVARSGSITIAAGTLTQTIAITVNGDTTVEGNETFVVNLTGATNATIADNQGLGTILNND